jgi:ribosomal protein S24E
MNIQVLVERENPLLKRKEVIVSLEYNGKATVSKAELQAMISKQFNADAESVEVSKILSEVGLPKGKAWVKIWKEKKVPLYASKKKKEEKAEEAKEEPKAEAKDEPKAEEPKEEKKEEEKKE